jgi:hypothetical protein
MRWPWTSGWGTACGPAVRERDGSAAYLWAAKPLWKAGAEVALRARSSGAAVEGRCMPNRRAWTSSANGSPTTPTAPSWMAHSRRPWLGADLFIGVSAPDLLTGEDIATMADKSIVFALANLVQEVDPVLAGEYAAVVARGPRSTRTSPLAFGLKAVGNPKPLRRPLNSTPMTFVGSAEQVQGSRQGSNTFG